MKIKLSVILAVIIICPLLMGAEYFAPRIGGIDSTVKVHDYALLFTAEEKQRLEEYAEDYTAQTSYDFVVFTYDEDTGMTRHQSAEAFYNEGGFSKNGLLLYINMRTRDVYIFLNEDLSGTRSTQVHDSFLDEIVPKLSDGEYYAAVMSYMELSLDFVTENPEHFDRESDNFDTTIPAPDRETNYYQDNTYAGPAQKTVRGVVGTAVRGASFITILAGAAILVFHIVSTAKKPALITYFKGAGINVYRSEDIFTGTHTTKTRHQSSDSGGGSGGGGRSSGGGRSFSSGGGSSSSSSGGGRKF